MKTKAVNQTQEIIRKELHKLKTDVVNQAELAKSKNLILGSIYRSIDSPRELPRILANMEIHFENENALAEYTNIINTVSEQDIIKAAKKYFEEENYSTVTVLPKKR